jgi:TP901 family phage tail tape measure protein
MIVRELVTFLGLEGDERSVKKWDESYRTLRNTAIGVAGAIAGASTAVFAFTASTARAGNEIAKASVEAGLSIQKYQELRFALQRLSRASEGEIDRAFGTLTQSIGRARREGGRYAEALQAIGFSQKEISNGSVTSERAIQRLSLALRNTASDADAAVLAGDLFGDRIGRRLGPAIRSSADSLQDLQSRFRNLGSGFTEEGAKAAEQFEDSMLDLRSTIQSVRIEIGQFLIPSIREIVEDTTEWIRANRQMIRQNLQGTLRTLVARLKEFWSITRRAMIEVDRFAESIGGWPVIFQAIKIAIGAWLTLKTIGLLGMFSAAIKKAGGSVAFLAMSLKKIPMIALAAALALILEDIFYWTQGNESVMGRMLGSFDDFKKSMKELGSILSDAIKDGDFTKLDDLAAKLGGGFGSAVRKFFVEAFSKFDESDASAIANGLWDLIKSSMNLFLNAMTGGSSFFGKLFGQGLLGALNLPETGVIGALRGDTREADTIQRIVGRDNLESVGEVRSVAPGSTKTITRQINIKSEATLQVPQGTSEEQQKVMREQAEKIIQEQWDKEIRKAANDFPGVD